VLSLGAFRSRAVEKIESPEQLDTRIKPAKPGAWIALLTLLIALIIAVVWSIVSTVPVTVGGTGFFLPKEGWNSVQAATAGIVSVLDVQVNDPVVSGEALALITDAAGDSVTVRSPVTGYVVEVAVSQQEYVNPGIQMAVIRPLDDTLVVHAYIPTGLAHEIPVGADTEISPSTVSPSAYGFLKGRVVSVAPFPATQQRLQEVLQNESLVQQVSSSGPVTEVLMSLQPAHTPSGYAWSIGEGPSYAALTGGLPADVTIVVGSRHPISYIS
jgi:multidrug efflux pump subunit AcrA (membrane-fusion protein)